MTFLMLALIKAYRLFLKPFLNQTCLYRESCSVHVERITKEQGFRQGLRALTLRIENCREGYTILGTGEDLQLITRTRSIVPKEAINPQLLEHYSKT